MLLKFEKYPNWKHLIEGLLTFFLEFKRTWLLGFLVNFVCLLRTHRFIAFTYIVIQEKFVFKNYSGGLSTKGRFGVCYDYKLYMVSKHMFKYFKGNTPKRPVRVRTSLIFYILFSNQWESVFLSLKWNVGSKTETNRFPCQAREL